MHETRSTVLNPIMARYGISPQAQARLASGKALGTKTAETLLAAPWATASAKRSVAYKLQGQAMLRWLAGSTPRSCSRSEAASLIASYPTWGFVNAGPLRVHRYVISELLEHRPDLLPAAAALDPRWPFAQAVADSRLLTDQATQELLLATITAYVKTAAYVDERTCLSELAGLIANPVVTADVAQRATTLATEVDIRRSWTKSTELSRAVRIRKRLNRLATKAGSRSAGAARPESFKDGALVDPYATTSDQVVIGFLAGVRGGVHDVYNTAALASNPHLEDYYAEKVGRRFLRLRYLTGGKAELLAAQAIFSANYPYVAAQLDLEKKGVYDHHRPWHYPKPPNQAFYLTEIANQGSRRASWAGTFPKAGYPVPVKRITGAALVTDYRTRQAAMNGIARYMASRLGNNHAAWSMLFGIAAAFEQSDLDSLLDACLRLCAQ
jgi:hypothetical protein